MPSLKPEPLSAKAFDTYGEVIETTGQAATIINGGNCLRYSDLVSHDVCESGTVGISLFDAKPYQTPVLLTSVERHPLGSQAFLPTNHDPYLVIVAGDAGGTPVDPQVFITSGYQGVNYHRNTWHAVLTPIVRQSLFVVVDYIGERENLQEYKFATPYLIEAVNC